MDLIIINGSLLTMDARQPRAEAVAVRAGKIEAIGSTEDILSLRNEKTLVIDAQGRSVLPGFNDSHLHLYGYALSKNRVDVSGPDSIQALRESIREHILRKHPDPGEWIIGRGWDQTPYPEQRMPDRHDLDCVSGDNPLLLMRKCGHVCVLNTLALKASGIFENMPAVEGGVIETDDDGKPSGILKENAMDLVKLPAQSADSKTAKALILSAAADFVKAGLTSVQTDDLGAFGGEAADLFKAYFDLAQEGLLPLRVNEQMLVSSPDVLKHLIEQGFVTGFGHDFFKIGPLKLLTDGSLGGRSALLSAPYQDDPGNFGIALFTKEQLKRLMLLAHGANMQIAAHAIGDGAIEQVLDLFREVQHEFARPDPRLRIVHASLTPPRLVDRMKEQGVGADVQPCFIPADMPFINSRLGEERASFAYCFKDFLRHGIPMGGSSDCPVEDYRPLKGIHAAVNRQDEDAKPVEGWLKEQKLTLHEALSLYTLGSAYQSFEENIKGSISKGKLADLVILSEDIEKIKPRQIKELSVDKTIVGGKIVYSL